jgi:hypothetical protein
MATMKKVAPKAQEGKKLSKKTDANTTIQKANLDSKYNQIYAQTKRDSVAESNKELPYTYARLRSKTGKSPSVATLRAAQDKQNKEVVKKVNSPDNLISSKDPKARQKMEIMANRRKKLLKTQGRSPLDAKGRADAIFMGMKSGGTVKKKMRNGGSLSGLKASTKRVGPVDPKGAFTKVQKKTLAGARGKASLTKDKQLGATKMAKRGMSVSKKK